MLGSVLGSVGERGGVVLCVGHVRAVGGEGVDVVGGEHEGSRHGRRGGGSVMGFRPDYLFRN